MKAHPYPTFSRITLHTRSCPCSYKDCDKVAAIHNGFDKFVRKCRKKAINRRSKELQCQPGWEKKGALCYKPCREGEKDAGLTCYTPKYEMWSLAKLAKKFNDFVESIKNIPGVNEIMKLVERLVNEIMAPVMKALNFPKLATFSALPSARDFPLGSIVDKMDALALVDVDINIPSKIETVLSSVLSAAEKLVPKDLLDTPNLSGLISKIAPDGLDIFDAPKRVQAALDGAATGIVSALPKDGLACKDWKDHTVPITEPIAKALGRLDDSDWCPASLTFTMCTEIDFSPLSKAMRPVLQAMYASFASSSSNSLLEEGVALLEEGAAAQTKRGLRSGDRKSIEEEFWEKISSSANQWGVNFGTGIVDELLTHLVPSVKIGLRPGGLERATLGRAGAFMTRMGLDKTEASKTQTDGATDKGNFASGFVELAPTVAFGIDVGQQDKKPYIDFKINIALDVLVEAGLTNPSAVNLAYKKASTAFLDVDRLLMKMAYSTELREMWDHPQCTGSQCPQNVQDQFRRICPWTSSKEYSKAMELPGANLWGERSPDEVERLRNQAKEHLRANFCDSSNWPLYKPYTALFTRTMGDSGAGPCLNLCKAFLESVYVPTRKVWSNSDSTKKDLQEFVKGINFATEWQNLGKKNGDATRKTLKLLNEVTNDMREKSQALYDEALFVSGKYFKAKNKQMRLAAKNFVKKNAKSFVSSISVYHNEPRFANAIMGTPCSSCTGEMITPTFSWCIGVMDSATDAEIKFEFNDDVGFDKDGGLYKVDIGFAGITNSAKAGVKALLDKKEKIFSKDMLEGKGVKVGVAWDIPIYREYDVLS